MSGAFAAIVRAAARCVSLLKFQYLSVWYRMIGVCDGVQRGIDAKCLSICFHVKGKGRAGIMGGVERDGARRARRGKREREREAANEIDVCRTEDRKRQR
jgi:hypothetical protein